MMEEMEDHEMDMGSEMEEQDVQPAEQEDEEYEQVAEDLKQTNMSRD